MFNFIWFYFQESSVLRLITFLAGSIVPTRYEWLTKLDSLLDKYFKQETRPNIRVKVSRIKNYS